MVWIGDLDCVGLKGLLGARVHDVEVQGAGVTWKLPKIMCPGEPCMGKAILRNS